MDNEVWRPVEKFPLYEVSDQGRVRSWACFGKRGALGERRAAPFILERSAPLEGGARRVLLSRHTPSGHRVRKMFTVARLVLTAFVGPPGPAVDARPLNGDAADLRLTNLRWSNSPDLVGVLPTRPRGEACHAAKLNEVIVREIRKLAASTPRDKRAQLVADLARRFDVSTAAIGNVILRRTWKHVA